MRYYINFQSGDQLAKDDEGIELPSLEPAWKAALISAAKSLRMKSKLTPKTRYGLSSSQATTVRTF